MKRGILENKFHNFPPIPEEISSFNLSNNEIVEMSNLKAFADNKIYVSEKLKFVLGRLETILGKGKNIGFLLFS